MESKEAICEALRGLVLAYPFDSISIQGVCDKAGLSRKTFSRNFADLKEVVRYQICLDFVKPVCGLHHIMGQVPYSTTMAFERNLAVFKENSEYYGRICKHFGSAWFSEQYSQLILDIDFEPYANHSLNAVELSFVEHFFAHASAEAFRWWIDGGMVVPEKEVARLIDDWLYAHCREMGFEGR